MSKTRYELKPGVNSARVGSIVIDEHGYATADPAEQELLDANPDIVKAKETPAVKETT